MLFSMLPEWSFTLLSLIARLLMWLPKLSQMRPPFWCGNSADFGHMKKVREKKRDCFGTYFPRVRTCDNVRVQSATEWTARVHTLHMPKPVITFVFKVLQKGLLRYILSTCPNL